MSIFEKLFGIGKTEKREAVPISDPTITRILGGSSPVDLATKLSTSSRCIDLISSAYAGNDQVLYRQTKEGPVEAESHPLHSLLLNGTPTLSAFELKYRLMSSFLEHGESFATVVFDDAGKPVDIVPHAWKNVTPEALGNGKLRYRVSDPLRNYVQTVVSADSMFHAKHRPSEYRGISPIRAAALSMGIGVGLEQSVSESASNGFKASGILAAPGAISDDTAKQLSNQLRDNYSGSDKAGRVIVVGDGLTYTGISNTSAESEVLASRKFSAYQVAQAFNCPPESVGLVEHSSWSSSEESNRQLVTLCLEGWAQSVNQQLCAFVLSPRERKNLYIASNWSKLLTGNLQTKAAAYASLVVNGILSINEARSEGFDLGKVDGGEAIRIPLNTAGLHDPAKNGQHAAGGAA